MGNPATAQEFMRTQRWAEAAEALSEAAEGRSALGFQRNICRNLDALQRHRPAVYQAVLAAGGVERYTVGTSASGHPTIFYLQENGSRISLSPGNQPVASLTSTFAAIKAPYQAGQPVAMVGIGDGYLLKSCSLHPPAMPFEGQQAVYLFEIDAQAVLACLTIHDYTGPGGPIEQERFQWFVGPGYIDQARECLQGDLFNPTPQFDVSQSPRAAEMGIAIRGLLEDTLALFGSYRERVRSYYAGLPSGHWSAVFSGKINRKPRVFLITTRLSSVLQYSTRDAAAGFEANGWETLVFIESKPHQLVSLAKLLQQLDEFKPDLIFQIDHLRSEWRGAIPPEVPFACWIQDHLPNLTKRAAGMTMTARDFALVGMPAMYIERYGYPAGQCVDLTKLTRLPQPPATWKSEGDDLAYVSSASQQPRELAVELTRRFADSKELSQLVSAACEDLIERYERGESLPTLHAVSEAFKAVEDRMGMAIDAGEMRHQVIDSLFDRMSNLLYRQQGLRWAAAVAAKQGLSLAIYGPGWEKHPEFSPFARGVVKYGASLEELTRKTKINLVLEPFLAVSHQRLLDGLVAGGFFLVRDHLSNKLFPELLSYIMEIAPYAETTEQVRRAAADRGEIDRCEEMLHRCECLGGYGDIVTIVRSGERSGVLPIGEATLPGLSVVSFGSQKELDGRTMAFISDEPSRKRIAERQRESVESRFSYAAGMRRVVTRIQDVILAERNSEAA